MTTSSTAVTTHEDTINRFYTAFTRLDANAMATCYAKDATFDDPAFSLRGQQKVAGMWRMLCSATQAKGLADWGLEFGNVHAHSNNGTAHWEAHYKFSATGRLVHNIVDAEFTFSPEGLIATPRDTFDFWRWSRQALGAPGLLLGWTPFLRAKVRAQAGANLQKFLAAQP